MLGGVGWCWLVLAGVGARSYLPSTTILNTIHNYS